jgi:Sap-like sulfolipid-1-addressing protein
MNAAFFGLAFFAALNPKFLGVDLLLMQNARPRLMFLCFLLGGMGMALAIGLLDVFVLQADAVQTQGSVSAGLDLALGVPLLAIGVLVATGRLHGRRRAPVPAGDGGPSKDGWAQRVLRQPRLGLVIVIGAVAGTPGGAYVTALHQLVTGKSPTAAQAVAVVVFVLIEFSLVIIPLVLLEVRPEGTKAWLERAQHWLMSHARQLIAAVAMLVGAYMAISGLVRLS